MSPRARERTPLGPHVTRVQACCKHRNAARSGACADCYGESIVAFDRVDRERLELELKLQQACGFAFDTGRRVAGLEMFIERQLVRR